MSSVSYIKSDRDYIIRVAGLKVYFPIRGGLLQRIRGYVRAVDGVDLDIPRGSVVGLVGESGCGKTTIAKTILGLIPPTSGKIIFDGIDLVNADKRTIKVIRRRIQYVPQDPYASLDPRQTVWSALYEAMKIHNIVGSKSEAYDKCIDLLESVGLSEEHLYRFPHELSGGQRQRVAIARALVTDPEVLILDEPTSFLDVSIQASILNLLKELRDNYGLNYLFISHNLAVVNYISEYVNVMYLGKIVESGPRDKIFEDPKHPYTYQLMQAIPTPDPSRRRDRALIRGEVPSVLNIPSGCRFHPRCPFATERCRSIEPPLTFVEGRYSACHYLIDFDAKRVVGDLDVG
jgi:oligopeptide/dipeptide ABC transporter ATP-binding protein